jgi:2-C-methyl-D-erythritol 2,4-cyclodiphosphate synthase
MLAEAAGHRVHLVEGDPRNIKITTPDDLIMAEALARQDARPARTGRAGIGYDLHRLVEGRPLLLGGVTIPSDRGALGHSDADVVCHAITDAVLGAASLGDIGRHFPDVDPRWKDASSLDLLRRAIAMLADEGLQVGNVDVTVILERPKIKDHIAAMRGALADALGVDVTRVSIKGRPTKAWTRSDVVKRLPRTPSPSYAADESSFRSQPNRSAARRQCAHRAVQLADGSQCGRDIRPAYRGHRTSPARRKRRRVPRSTIFAGLD